MSMTDIQEVEFRDLVKLLLLTLYKKDLVVKQPPNERMTRFQAEVLDQAAKEINEEFNLTGDNAFVDNVVTKYKEWKGEANDNHRAIHP